ncbi:MAG: hypothetical protein PHQ65_08705 [Bacteroidales bacterium]|nr:hypothetical protein [Bacteroidales bacterium]
MHYTMKTKNHNQLGLTPEAAARSVAGGGCDWEMEKQRDKDVLLQWIWGDKNPFGRYVN